VPIFRALRADLVKMGKAPTEPYKKVAASLKKSGNRFGTAKAKRTQWIPEGMDLPEKAEALYFPGCVATFKSPEIAQSTAKLLRHGGLEFAVLGEEEQCCGNPLSASGQQQAFEFLARHNVAAIQAAGARKVMTSCACCYNVLKFRYPEVVGDLDFEVVHTTEVLSGWIDEGKLKPKKRIPGTLTYQDPCHLTRVNSPGISIMEEPRKVIQSIPEVAIVEMEGSGMFTQCCGRNPYELPELSLNTGINRIRDAQAAGADTIVTSCSFCDWSLGRAAKGVDPEIRVMDITSLLSQALDL
jgi:Fe-S oxidoreductase